MTAAQVTADELALELGVVTRTVRNWIARGLPARKDGRPPRWHIDRDAATAWLRLNGPPGLADGITLPPPEPQPPASGPPPSTEADAAAGLGRHIDRLDRILAGFTDLVFNAQEFDPRLVTSLKSISTELRRLDLHRLEMRKAEAALMDRDDHVRILGTFARLVVDEIQAWARSTPDAVVDALTGAGVKVKAKATIRALDLALGEKAAELRTRITEAVTQAEDIE